MLNIISQYCIHTLYEIIRKLQKAGPTNNRKVMDARGVKNTVQLSEVIVQARGEYAIKNNGSKLGLRLRVPF